MLRRIGKPLRPAIVQLVRSGKPLRPAVSHRSLRILFTSRPFSSDSHDDFKPIKKAAAPQTGTVQERIAQAVASSDVLLFMKGTPEFPQCGFSRQVALILNHENVKFDSVDVLADAEIREGVKIFSKWPTIPQLYVKGEFIGGCDIVTQMYQSGELMKLLAPMKK